MKIVVLGGYGDMGQGAVQDLIAHTDAEVVIADYRIEKAKEYAAQLGPRATAVFVDANDVAPRGGLVRTRACCPGTSSLNLMEEGEGADWV